MRLSNEEDLLLRIGFQANFAKKVKYSAPIAKPTAKVVSEKNIKNFDGRVLSYSSNIKHVNGKDPGAGLEPNNVIELFKNSVPSNAVMMLKRCKIFCWFKGKYS